MGRAAAQLAEVGLLAPALGQQAERGRLHGPARAADWLTERRCCGVSRALSAIRAIRLRQSRQASACIRLALLTATPNCIRAAAAAIIRAIPPGTLRHCEMTRRDMGVQWSRTRSPPRPKPPARANQLSCAQSKRAGSPRPAPRIADG